MAATTFLTGVSWAPSRRRYGVVTASESVLRSLLGIAVWPRRGAPGQVGADQQRPCHTKMSVRVHKSLLLVMPYLSALSAAPPGGASRELPTPVASQVVIALSGHGI